MASEKQWTVQLISGHKCWKSRDQSTPILNSKEDVS